MCPPYCLFFDGFTIPERNKKFCDIVTVLLEKAAGMSYNKKQHKCRFLYGGAMGIKGNRRREEILRQSGKLFAEKGYTAVTMQQVCGSCRLSRGGLYRYFGSTKEIFE